MRQAPLRGLAAAPAGLAIRRCDSGQALFRAFPGPGALITEQHEGFIGLDDAGQDRTSHRGGEKTVAPAKRGADRHATPLGRGDHRFAFAQRLAEVEPALLLPQPGQRRAGQRVEAPAASLAAEPPQSVGLAAAAPWPQCGQRRSSPGLVSITAVTAAREGRPASTSSSSRRWSSVRSSTSASHARKTPCSITNSINTRWILPWVAVPT